MTPAQRHIALTWAIACASLSLVFVFWPWLGGEWFRYALLALIPIAMKWDRSAPPNLPGNAASRAVARYPWITAWLAVCAMLSVALVFVGARTGVRIWDFMEGRGVLAAIVMLVAPLFVAIEKERFAAAGAE